jgi:putative RecB family exonuclease
MNELLRVLEGMNSRPKEYSRVQSPSSVNTYLACPRQYFYRYIKELPSKPSIHLIRGKLVHTVLEDFFELKPEKLNQKSFAFEMNIVLLEAFKRLWEANKVELEGLRLHPDELQSYFESSKAMIACFVQDFASRLAHLLEKLGFVEAFRALTPRREVYLESHSHRVRGYVDAIFEHGKTQIIDYKTSASDAFRDEYRRQLGIYALMFREKYGRLPDEVGLHFLAFGRKLIPATDELVNTAANAVSFVHQHTKYGSVNDYPKGKNPLCKWSTGQCDFFEVCGGR